MRWNTWFDAREATEFGAELADRFAARIKPPQATGGKKTEPKDLGKLLDDVFLRAPHEIRSLRLNFYKRAKFANSFKWRLLEHGVPDKIASEVTEALALRISVRRARVRR